MIKHKAIMIGAGLANMAAAVYLIQEAHWQGDQITFYSLDDHGSNDGAPTVDTVDEYWNKNHPMENTKGYVRFLYTSDAADDQPRVDLGGCRII